MDQYLVEIGVPSIKKYVFGTDHSSEITGASALLNYLSVELTRKFMDKPNVECISLGGGTGQFIITADEDELEKYMRELESIFSRETRNGLRLIHGKSKYSGTNYHEARKVAAYKSKEKKEEYPIIPCTQIHTGYVSECDSCSAMASQVNKMYEDNENQVLCEVCYRKTEYSKEAKKGLWYEFFNYLQQKKCETAKRPINFEEIGEQCSARKGYIALVYADGNAMGKLIKEIESKEQYAFFSKTVDNAIREACHEALYEIFIKNVNKKPEILGADILLLGGDDLIVYLTAESAFPFAIRAAKIFNEKTKQKFATPRGSFFEKKLKSRGLTISLGIAYGKSHTPFSILLNQAEELLKSAKKEGSKDKRSEKYYAPAYIDYHLSTIFNQIHVSDCRANHLELSRDNGKNIKLYQRPYSLEDAEAILKYAKALVKKGIPKTRLRRLGYAPSLGKVNGTLECLKLYTRTKKGEQRLAIWDALEHFGCIKNIPWNEDTDPYTTVLVDLIELAEFCGKENSPII
ncbi:MAG: hypothetical protein GY795_37010 [Desulfobacterales bacterium]|nr:hypothetical protein [Desulfobacterales bacterium]